MAVEEIAVLFILYVLHQLGVHYFLVNMDDVVESSVIRNEVPALFQRDGCFIHHLVLGFLPIYLEVCLGN